MKKDPSNNQSPWERRSVPPAQTYFTDQALPPDSYIETDQALPADGHVEEDLDCSYLLQGLWPESAKNWFVWNKGEKSRAIEVAVNIEKLCEDEDYDERWREKIKEFVKFKAPYDEKIVAGKYVDPHEDWPFSPEHSREVVLPGDLPALYALLCRFHDWLPGFDQLFSEEDPAVIEFSSCSSTLDFEQRFEQRSVHIEELEKFLIIVKQDIKDNLVRQQVKNLIENRNRQAPDESKTTKIDEVDSKIIEVYQRYDTEKVKNSDLRYPGCRKIAKRCKEAGISEESHTKINNRIKRLRAAGLINNARKKKEQTCDPQMLEQMISNGRAKPVKAIE